MSFFEDASLVLIPSAQKLSKIYSVKPTDGSGDLAFTRSNDTATRVASNGLIEKVRTNVILQSNTFNVTWEPTDATITSGATDPNGGTTAWTLANTAASGIIQQPATLTGLRSVSIYAKQGTHRYLYMGIYVGSGTQSYQVFDLQNGVITSGSSGRIESVGNGWYRCTSFGADGTTGGVQIFPSNNSLGAGTTNGNILIWRCQYESGDIATPYIATTAAVSVGPVANVPRLDYLGSTCPRLLLEPQRTNSITSSESTATGWTFTNSSSAVNQTASPDGYVNADSIIPDATSGQHAINSANITASGSFTLSAFVKAGEHTKVAIRESANTGSYASFNLATGTKIEDNVSGASFIQSYGNGWYRIGVTGTYSGSIRLGINVLSNAYTTGNPSSGTTFFSGNASDKLFCWGMQAELGATYATSLIPTYGAAVTRGADVASKTGISSLIGQTEGTMFLDADYIASSGVGNFNTLLVLSPTGGVGGGYVVIDRYPDNTVVCEYNQGGSQAKIISATTYGNQRLKIAFAYKANDFVAYVNGVQIGADNSGTTGLTLNELVMPYMPNTPFGGKIGQALLFKTRLTNAQLAELTTI